MPKDNLIYLSRISASYAVKNKFEIAVRDLVKKYDRLLVESPDIFAYELTSEIEALHKKHPRCSALPVKTDNRRRDGQDIFIQIGGIIHFHLHVINGRFGTAGIQPFISFEKGGAAQNLHL
ncbi:hypothetical protein [Dyadobacter diqingensis]|uniref:hypothetical protein n=1 Tax=Dyadobacter diqingensis TaxID=2938121 RepID=UPI0020C34772|nr:hypothetical protein [Dyadobacter diqingensis]